MAVGQPQPPRKTNKLGEVESGIFYCPVGVKGPIKGDVGNDKLAQKLWDWTEKELDDWMVKNDK